MTPKVVITREPRAVFGLHFSDDYRRIWRENMTHLYINTFISLWHCKDYL